jgi:sulfate permease, SulP family
LKLPAYSWRQLQGDGFGGLIAALIALPYGLAMAAMMGLPPELGLFSSIVSAPATALLGRNPVLIGGASTVTVPFLAAAVAQFGIAGAAKVTIIAGVFLMAFSVMRLGRLITKIPPVVVSGFSCGIGGMMIISQLKVIFGLPAPAGGWAESMVGQLAQVVEGLPAAHLAPLLLALIVMVAASISSRISSKLPAPLVGVLVACAVSVSTGLHARQVGKISIQIPDFVSFSWTPRDLFSVLPAAAGLALVASANLLVTSRLVYHFLGDHKRQKRADHDRDLGAYGIANVLTGMFGAPMSVGIPARSLANVRCGGRTMVSNLFHAAFLAIAVYGGASWIALIPVAALAGVTAWIGAYLLDWSTWRRLRLLRRSEAAAFVVTALGVQYWNPVVAVGLGAAVHFAPAAIAWLRGHGLRPMVAESAPGS